jgi:hypothetical protein
VIFNPGALIIIMLLAAIAVALARFSNWLVPGASRTSKIFASVLIVPGVLFAAGFSAFVESVAWLFFWPAATWINLAAVVLSALTAAWLGVGRKGSTDTAVFQ